VALINEPMIKGIAKAAAKAELVNGKFTAGFTATEGCVGIHTNLSWRNRLYGDVLGIKQFDIMDTGYKSIKSACIAIGKQPTTPAVGDGSTTNPATPAQGNGSTTNPATPAEGDDEDQAATPQTPSGGAAQPSTPQTPADDDATPSTPQTPANNGNEAATPQTPANNGEQVATPQTPVSNDAQTPSAGSDDAAPEKRTLSSRQFTSITATNGTLPGGLRDLTDSVKKATDIVTYAMSDIPTTPYTRTDGYEFTKILAEEGEYNML
jgi:hypothetical protein